jgi:hypothetical protein
MLLATSKRCTTPSFALWTHRSGMGEMWRSPRTISVTLIRKRLLHILSSLR